MKGRSVKISPFTGFVKESEIKFYRDRLGNLKQEKTAYAEYGTQLIIDLTDHHENLKRFLEDLNAHDIAKIEDEEKAEFVRQTQSIVEEWIALFDFMVLAREGALEFPKPEA